MADPTASTPLSVDVNGTWPSYFGGGRLSTEKANLPVGEYTVERRSQSGGTMKEDLIDITSLRCKARDSSSLRV